MYFSKDNLEISLENLKRVHPFFGIAFLGFKKIGLPVGRTVNFRYSMIKEKILVPYYKPSTEYGGYYSPFKTSNTAKRWLSPRYDSTSLQRITADTFGEAFIHKKNSHQWGWQVGYVETLDELRIRQRSAKIPAFDLAVWIFRNYRWPTNTSSSLVVEKLFSHFGIDESEQQTLFESSLFERQDIRLDTTPLDEKEILDIIGHPPGQEEWEGGALDYLRLRNVGPASDLRYEANRRLNIVTGDNSLGKTFLLECIWWALTDHWIDHQAEPRRAASKKSPEIEYSIFTSENRTHSTSAKYEWDTQIWRGTSTRQLLNGIAVYCRHDGSFDTWDPYRSINANLERFSHKSDNSNYITLTRYEVWDGLLGDVRSGHQRYLCNGIIRDWVTWQTAGSRYENVFAAFVKCLESLSPAVGESLVVGDPVRIPRDSREIPTLKMPYGDVPIVYASAAVQRILALAYLIVWSWSEHNAQSDLIRRPPLERIVLVIDEIEAHLHPKWQRSIVPSVISVISDIAKFVDTQIHIATHSPLVLASAEPIFDQSSDALHHLDLAGHSVVVDQVEFVKEGTIDSWLTSEIFGLSHARSIEGERAIEIAKFLQLQDDPDPLEVARANSTLVKVLADDDPFWPRWRFFAEQFGGEHDSS